MGGTSGAGFNNESQPVLTPEMWNPQTGTWSTLNNLQIPRLYHSAAVLLPDGRVLIGGGGRCDGCTDHPDAQIFSPPYLFATNGLPAVRPTINSVPASVSYGQTFAVQTPDVSAISRVTWVRLPIATHTFNQNQWINELTFTKTPGSSRLNVATPANAYLAPPGHYMLFILNSSGVPSVAKIVQLQGSAALPPAPAKPPAPSKLLASSVDDQRIQLSWIDNSNSETDFLVERCLGSGCTDFQEVAQLEPQTTRYPMASLAKGTAYTFRVRARNEAGYSAYSNAAIGSTTTGETVAVRTLVSQLANKCVEDDGGGQLNATRIFIMPCTGATKQQWTAPPSGYPGEISIFGTMCIDAYGAQGNPGDRIELWECSGGTNQQWTLNSAGELKGINGLCIALNGGATSDSTRMAIQPCTGEPAQKWKYGTADGNLPPVAAFSYQCTDLTCGFSDSSTDDGGVIGWSWNFGDAVGSSSVQNPNYTFTTAGSYQVKLTATDDKGATASITQTVTVTSATTNTAPTASFTPSCTNFACTFTDASTDSDGSVTSWSWSFGDGGTSTTQNPNHTYTAAGTYDVTLTATDNGGATGTKTVSVTVTAAPPANGPPTASFTPSCTNFACTFTDSSTDSDGSVTSWGWSFGDGGTSTAQNPNHTYTAAGTYNVTLTATDNGGATGAKTVSVTVTAAPPANAPPTASFSSRCTDLTCSFTDGSTDSDGNVTGWSWTFGDGSSSSTQNPSRTYSAAGTYTVALTATDNGGATSQYSAPVTVTAPTPSTRLSDSFNRIVAAGVGSADGGSDADKAWVTWEGANADVTVDGSALVLKKDTGGWRALVGSGELGQPRCDR